MKAIFAAGVMAALLAAPVQGGAMKVSEQVQVVSSGGKVVVTLALDNAGAAPVHVPKALYQDKELFGRLFTVTNAATGAEVDYIGPMVKRGPYGKDDFIAVQPGKKLSNSIDITRAYDFKPGTHKYQLRHAGSYVADLGKVESSTALTSAPVTFSHTGK